MTNERLKIAVQKSGRLSELSLTLLEKCGIKVEKRQNQLLCKALNFPLDVLLVRDDDIPAFVAKDVCQLGIVGENVLLEEAAAADIDFSLIETVLKLGSGKCRLSLAIPKEDQYQGLEYFRNKTIATSYKGLLNQFLKEQNIKANIVTMQGAVEIAPKTKLADAICDLVSSGDTLASNGLKEVEILLQSQAVLITNKSIPAELQEIYDQLLTRMQAVLKAENSRYIMLHAPIASLDSIKSILPGMETPTILPLQGQADKVALHAVCNEKIFWDTMHELKAKGASSILILPIEKILD